MNATAERLSLAQVKETLFELERCVRVEERAEARFVAARSSGTLQDYQDAIFARRLAHAACCRAAGYEVPQPERTHEPRMQ